MLFFVQIRSGKGPPNRADILLSALKELLESLFSHPVDANLICAVNLLKLTGSILDDAWKKRGESHMEELVRRIETILLDATCSRCVYYRPNLCLEDLNLSKLCKTNLPINVQLVIEGSHPLFLFCFV
ncbi:hypothetical protein XENORESO_020510 [Xenotaenia resolanae]|uniref:Uncharacterized protein n=1 Tax=Xenotaenia resolanae TaxID=208358 RepID=A0ABV0VRL3_9TELE